MTQKTMKQIRQRIYIETSKRKPEQIVLIFAQHLFLGGYREEGRKTLPFDAHAVTNFIQAHGNDTAALLRTYFTDNIYKMVIEVENCNYRLLD